MTSLNERHSHLLNEATSGNDSVISDLNEDLNKAHAQISELEQNKIATTNELQGLNEQLAHANEQISIFTSDNENSANVIEQYQASITEATDKIQSLESEMQSLNQAYEADKEEFAKQKSEFEQADARVSQAQTNVAELQNENAKLTSQMDFVKNNSIATVERLTTKSEQAMHKVRELEGTLAREKESSAQAKEERVKLKEQLEFMKHNQTTTFERLTNSAAKANAKVKELEQELAALKQ